MSSSTGLPAQGATASSSDLLRWGGLAAVVGGVLWALEPIGEDVLGGGGYPASPAYRPFSFVGAGMLILLIIGLVVLHTRYKSIYGRLGTAGAIVIFGAYALAFIGTIPSLLFAFPTGALRDAVLTGQTLGFFGALLAGVGAVLLGIALWRTWAAARPGALLLIISLPVGFPVVVALATTSFMEVSGLAVTVPYGGAWAILGYRLWSEGSASAQQPSRA